MSRGTLDKVYLAPELVNDRKCEVTCLLSDPKQVNPRKTSFINVVSPNYLGEVKSDIYSIDVEVPYPTVAELLANIDAVVTSFDLTPATIDVVTAGSYIKIGDELMVIQSITGNTVTVFSRGHGGTTAVAHTTAEPVFTLANVKATCEALGDCRLPQFKTSIENAVQKFDDCTQYCIEDMCRKLKDNCDVAGRDRVINDEKEKMKAIVRKNILEQLDNLFINGGYGFVTKGNKRAYTTRGLRQWILGVVDGNSVTHSGFVYDILAEDTCVGSTGGGDGTGRLTHDSLLAFYREAGRKASPQWTHVLVNYDGFLALDQVATRVDCCANPNDMKKLKTSMIDVVISTPYGDVKVIINDHVKSNEIMFFNENNVGWYSDCSIDGNVTREGEVNVDFEGKNKKWFIELFLALDASKNMCTNLAILYNFVKDSAC